MTRFRLRRRAARSAARNVVRTRMVMRRLDFWWEHKHQRRSDRGPVYVAVMCGVWLFALQALFLGPVEGSKVSELLSPLTHDLMTFCCLLGASCCLLGIASGSRWFRPHVTIRRAYTYSVVGMPALAVGLAVYGGAVVVTQPTPLAALAGTLGPLIALGDTVQALWLLLECRRIDRAIPIVEAVEKGHPLPAHPSHPPRKEPPAPPRGLA